MTHSKRILLAAGLLTALTASAWAQTATTPQGQAPAGMQHMHEHFQHHRMARHAQHLTALKTQLKLDTSQEAAWATFAQAMQAPGAKPQQPDRTALAKLSTPERLDQMQAFKVQRDAQMQMRMDATKTFYASLNPAQQKDFDKETARFMTEAMGPGMPLKHPMMQH